MRYQRFDLNLLGALRALLTTRSVTRAAESLHLSQSAMSGIRVLGHMGEGLPFWLQRLDNRYLLQVKIGAVKKMARLPSEYFLDHFVITTSGVMSAPALKLSIDVLGVDRIMFAADYPYESVAEGVTFLDSVDITDIQREKIYSKNAERFFKLI
jgi:2,3-dihydroxybenzoate decarboxylase